MNTSAAAGHAMEAGEFSRGWRVVLCALVGIALGLSPMPIYTIGMFAPHLAEDFGWSMSQIMGGITVTTISLLVAGPLAGWLSQRYGVRRVVLISQLLFAFSFMALSLSTGSLWLFYANWVLVTLTGAGTLPITFTNAVNLWFDKRRGLALGMAMMGTGLFGIACKPLLAWMIPEFGWRGAYIGLGLLPLLIALPVSWLFLSDSKPGDGTGKGDSTPAATRPGGLSLSEALHDWRYWLLIAAVFPISIVLSGPVPNMEGILTASGLEAGTIVALTPLIGLSAMLGRIIGGWLIDRFWAPAIGFAILSLPAISCLIFLTGDMTPAIAGLAIFLIGFALGIEYDLMAYFVSRYFGLKAYGAIYGLLYVFFALGAGFGPLLLGADFDRSGNFNLSFGIGAFVLVIGAASFLLLGRYRAFADESGA